MNRCSEIEFLPAALEIQETPASPIGRATLWSILGFFVLAVSWAWFSHVDIVAVAQGRIIPIGHSKRVQSLEMGIVRSVRVEEGQIVNAGDVLVELDPTSARADVARYRHERDTAAKEIDRYGQLAAWLKSPNAPSALGQTAVGDALLLRRWREYRDRQAVLERELDRQLAQRKSALQQARKLEAILPIISRQAEDQKGLAQQKLLSQQQYLLTEQQRLETHHDLRSAEARIEELSAAAQLLEARIASGQSEFYREVLERLETARHRFSAAEQELTKALSRIDSLTVVAPVTGKVQELAVHSRGAIVTPAQALMTIVPLDVALEVEAALENKDIGFVEVGQSVEVKVDAFPFTKYGTIEGEVVNLSSDSMTDEHKGLVYKMRVMLERLSIGTGDGVVRLTPGMTVTVESKTGTRRMLEFFLSPLLRYAKESVRER